MALHELAGQPAPRSLLADIPALVAAYYTRSPTRPSRRSGSPSAPRGTGVAPWRRSFNEAHILAITQAICEHRSGAGVTDGPLFLGMDTHALSEPALRPRALEVLAARGVTVLSSRDCGTPRPR